MTIQRVVRTRAIFYLNFKILTECPNVLVFAYLCKWIYGAVFTRFIFKEFEEMVTPAPNAYKCPKPDHLLMFILLRACTDGDSRQESFAWHRRDQFYRFASEWSLWDFWLLHHTKNRIYERRRMYDLVMSWQRAVPWRGELSLYILEWPARCHGLCSKSSGKNIRRNVALRESLHSKKCLCI